MSYKLLCNIFSSLFIEIWNASFVDFNKWFNYFFVARCMLWNVSKESWSTIFLFGVHCQMIGAFKLSCPSCWTSRIHPLLKLSPSRIPRLWNMRHGGHIILKTNVNATSIHFIKILQWLSKVKMLVSHTFVLNFG